MDSSVEVALAAYNGARWLPDQLDSILHQTRAVDRILVRDDGSRDQTAELIEEMGRSCGGRVRILPCDCPNLGPKGNFDRILGQTQAAYVFLADQDDVWRRDKVETAMAAMEELEARYGGDIPLYIYSDTRLVDAEGAPIAGSGWREQGFDGNSGTRFERLLAQNVVPGCTVLVNRALLDVALPIPSEAVMHDWWLLLAGCAFGHGARVDEPLVDYRQHGGNDLGSAPWGLKGILAGVWAGRSTLKRVRTNFDGALDQAQRFLDRYESRMPEQREAVVREFVRLPCESWVRRRINAVRMGLRKDSWLRSLALYLVM